MIKRPYLKYEWIEYIIENPFKVEYQIIDNRIRYWGYIEEFGNF